MYNDIRVNLSGLKSSQSVHPSAENLGCGHYITRYQLALVITYGDTATNWRPLADDM